MGSLISNCMRSIRERFTLWYVRKGHRFYYNGPIDNFEPVWVCPWYIRPLLIFFSPSIYEVEMNGRAMVEGFEEGLEKAKDDPTCIAFRANLYDRVIDPEPCPECGGEATLWKDKYSEIGVTIYHCGCKECGYSEFTSKNGLNGAIALWNDFVKRYSETMNDEVVIQKGEN